MQVGLDVWQIQVFVFEKEDEETFEKYALLSEWRTFEQRMTK